MRRLGYTRYGAQGSDWGTSISTLLAQHDRDHIAGIDLTPPLAPPDPATFDDLTAAERTALASLEHSSQWDSGYSKEHSTRPPDHRVRSRRLARGAVRLDHREILGLDRPRRRPADRAHPRRTPRQPDALLAARHRRLSRPPVLGKHPPGQPVDLRAGQRHHRHPGWMLGLPQRAPTSQPPLGRQTLHQHRLLERSRPGAATSPHSSNQNSSPAKSARSSASSGEPGIRYQAKPPTADSTRCRRAMASPPNMPIRSQPDSPACLPEGLAPAG